MADDDLDFKDILEGTVDEVKDRIRDLDAPDYEGLLNSEKEGKDRKTVREFLESKLPTEDEEEDEEEDSEEESEEKVVEEIEEETAGGLLGSYSPTSVLAGGVILGLVIGFVAAGFAGVSATGTDSGTQADAELVRESVQTIAGVGLNSTPDVSEPVVRNSMYNMNVTTNVQTENGTVEQAQEVFVTLDGEYLFIAQKQFGQYIRPLDLQNAVQRAQQSEQQQTVNQSQTEDSSVN